MKDGRVRISWVADGSPAAAAGVTSGDLLERVNDTPIDVKFSEQLPLVTQVLGGLPIDRPSRLELMRPSGPVVVTVQPTERGPAIAIPSELRDWGMVGSDLTQFAAREMARMAADSPGQRRRSERAR